MLTSKFPKQQGKLANYYMFQEICGTVWSVLLDDCDLGKPSRIQDCGMTGSLLKLHGRLPRKPSWLTWHSISLATFKIRSLNPLRENHFRAGCSEVGSWRFWYRFLLASGSKIPRYSGIVDVFRRASQQVCVKQWFWSHQKSLSSWPGRATGRDVFWMQQIFWISKL